MKTEEVIEALENTSYKGEEKSFIKHKEGIINVLKELRAKDLTENQKKLLEMELDGLFKGVNFEEVTLKEIKTGYRKLIQAVGQKLYFVPEGHYMGWGMILGVIIGMFLHVSPLLGLLIGMFIGGIMDSQAKKHNRTLKAKVY